MRRHGYAAGALLAVLLTALALLYINARTGNLPRIANFWPLLAALGMAVATWWLQGLIVAVLARPRLEKLRVLDTFGVYMAGTFVAGISPIRGAEIPCEVYLLKRLGLSTGEGSTVVGTRALLDVAVLTPATLFGLALASGFSGPINPELLLTGLIVTVTLATFILLIRKKRGWRPESGGPRRDWPGWLTTGRARSPGFSETCGRAAPPTGARDIGRP